MQGGIEAGGGGAGSGESDDACGNPGWGVLRERGGIGGTTEGVG